MGAEAFLAGGMGLMAWCRGMARGVREDVRGCEREDTGVGVEKEEVFESQVKGDETEEKGE